jgi:aminoglycoside/choline kinase family phosphotransferase
VVVQPIAEGEGFMGRLARLTLTYGDDGRDAGGGRPATMIAKLPTDDPGGVALGQMLRVWEREARFYLDLAERLPVRTPACYWAGGDADTGIFGLLLEDLGAFTGGDQIAGATTDQAAAALEWLGRMHAAETGGGHGAGLAWLPATDTDPMYLSLEPMLQAVYPTFVEHWGPYAPPETLPWVERMTTRLTAALTDRLLPPTLIHSDFRADNLFFDTAAGNDVIALDWQAVAIGQGLYDLAYFLGGSLTVEQRRASERDLVDHYREVLGASGVPVPDRGPFFDLYRRTLLYTMAIGHQLGVLTIERMFTAGADLQVDEFLD